MFRYILTSDIPLEGYASTITNAIYKMTGMPVAIVENWRGVRRQSSSVFPQERNLVDNPAMVNSTEGWEKMRVHFPPSTAELDIRDHVGIPPQGEKSMSDRVTYIIRNSVELDDIEIQQIRDLTDGSFETEIQQPLHPSTAEFIRILDEMKALHLKKGADYGSSTDPFQNVRSAEDIGIPGFISAFIRSRDKVQRISAFIRNGKLENESVEDSFLDNAVYNIIALVLFRQWKQKDETLAPFYEMIERIEAAKIEEQDHTEGMAFKEFYAEASQQKSVSTPYVSTPKRREPGRVYSDTTVEENHSDHKPEIIRLITELEGLLQAGATYSSFRSDALELLDALQTEATYLANL